MDPNANITEQRELAQRIVARPQTILSHGDDKSDRYSLPDSAARLAELVIALDEWRRSGGFDPYAQSSDLRDEIKAALEGDSNDAEHDALVAVADFFGIAYEASDEPSDDAFYNRPGFEGGIPDGSLNEESPDPGWMNP